IGSLSASTWDRAAVLACALAVLIPLLGLLVPRLRILQLGDDTATSLGLDVPRTRTSLVLVAVALCALTVAVTGPLSFVAFLAGPIAQRLAGRPSFPLSAVVGAVIVLLADIAGQNLFGATQLPAGVVTGALGAPLLMWMLARSPTSGSRRGHDGTARSSARPLGVRPPGDRPRPQPHPARGADHDHCGRQRQRQVHPAARHVPPAHPDGRRRRAGRPRHALPARQGARPP